MKLKIACIAMMLAAAPAWAGDSPIAALARTANLSERKVCMLLGNRTAYAEYTYTYDRSLRKLTRAIGRDNYERLMRGESVVLTLDGQRGVARVARRGFQFTEI